MSRLINRRLLLVAVFAVGILMGATGAVAIDRSTGEDNPSGQCIISRSILENPRQAQDAEALLKLAENYDKECR